MDQQQIEKEFLEMVRQYERIIYKVSSFYVNENTTLDDLFQDVILNLWKAFPSFRHESSPSTWIYRIALNTCVSFFRRGKSRPAFVGITADMIDEPGNHELIKELYVLVNRLGKLEKALVLLYLEDRPYKEIADIMGMTVTNVSTRLGRIKEKLKQLSNQ